MRFCYINTENKYPHDIHIIQGLRENGHEVIEICDKNQGFKKYKNITKIYKTTDRCFDAVIIGFTCPHFVPLARLITTNPVIFNGVSSQYEANVISRGNLGDERTSLLRAIKYWLIDFLSFHLPSKVLLESTSQINFVHRFFLVPRKKLILSWTGVDEKEFYLEPHVEKNKEFTVLFRGRFLPESGIDTVIKASKLLEKKDTQFLIIGHGHLYKLVGELTKTLNPSNLTLITERIPMDTLRKKMLECHISLGQLADHPRLDRTLPCKLFESLALGLPYLTGRNVAALELLQENKTCICVNPGDPEDLAQKIIHLKNNPKILKNIGENGYNLYKEKLTSKTLAKQMIESCLS